MSEYEFLSHEWVIECKVQGVWLETKICQYETTAKREIKKLRTENPGLYYRLVRILKTAEYEG